MAVRLKPDTTTIGYSTIAIGEAGRYDNRLQQTRWRLPKPDVTTIGYSTMAIAEAGRYDNRLQHDGDCRSRRFDGPVKAGHYDHRLFTEP